MASTMKTMKRTILTSIFALSTVAFSAQAAEPEYDSYGLRSNPTCAREQSTERYYVKIRNQPPSGIKAENDKWKMEIYANKETGDWIVLGRSKTADIDQTKLCGLAVGQGPYQQFKWYQEFFAKKPLPNNIATETVVTPKPKLN